jgi:hypothetical protein
MKLFQTLGVLLALGCAASAGAAETRDTLRVHVPFAFVVAGQEFAPGDYIVNETDSGVVSVQGRGKAAMVLTYPSVPHYGVAGLRFTKSGEKLYLVGVQSQTTSSGLPLTQAK